MAVLAELRQGFPAFQRALVAVDEAAAEVLALEETDLRCIDVLRQGPLDDVALAGAPAASRRRVVMLVARLESTGFVRTRVEAGARLRELTPLAEQWVETIWGPLRDEGAGLLSGYSTPELGALARFMRECGGLQLRHAGRIAAMTEAPRAVRSRGGLSPAALRRVQLFVDANLGTPLRLEALAERAGVSLFHFARAFRVSTGETPSAYVRRLRVERALRLLRETELSIGRIALDCGYSSQSKLGTAVRAATRLTPARYRAAQRAARQVEMPAPANRRP